jgi:hypothetical protein
VKQVIREEGAPSGKLKFAYDSIVNLEQQIDTLRAQLAASEARAEQLRAQRDAWKHAAEHQYGLLRASLYGESDENYPVQGALDAWAVGRYPALRAALAEGEADFA